MSTPTNVFSQGGGGTNYEFNIHAAYFINFLIGGAVPGLPSTKIVSFRQQSDSLGYKIDDLLLICETPTGEKHRALFQIKHDITISEKNDLFKEVIADSWADFSNKTLFDSVKDKIYLIKSHLTKDEKNHLVPLLDWARVKATLSDFLNEVNRITEKRRYYSILSKLLTEAKGSPASDEECFAFIKCFELLEYDFGSANSNAQANMLTVINITKAADVKLSATDIWAKIHSFVGDSDSKGGEFMINNIPPDIAGIFNHNYLPGIYKQLNQLSEQSEEIIGLIDDSIGNLIHLSRHTYINEAHSLLNERQLLLITGGAGIGKSAVAKEIVLNKQRLGKGYLIALKADSLNGNLRDIFKDYGLNLTAQEIFSHFPLHVEHLIYIDSLEKLLEMEGDGFRQLIKLLPKYSNIKLIASCRSLSLNLIRIKFLGETEFHQKEILPINDQELNVIKDKIPQFGSLLSNTRLASILRIPKYLDFAYKVVKDGVDSGYSELNEVGFVKQLWEIIIENKMNEDKDGLPQRRAEIFIEIAVKRAKTMEPFVLAGNVDPVAIQKLKKDNLLIEDKNGKLSPAHDVLEDWALIRFVARQYNIAENAQQFFELLGTEPATRRAYRLWVYSSLKEQDSEKINFFSTVIQSQSVRGYWRDECIIAILQSDYCDSFINSNEALLLSEQGNLLYKFIHLLRTACKQPVPGEAGSRQFVASGYGWEALIEFANKHLKQLPKEFNSILFSLLSDWEKVLDSFTDTPKALNSAGQIAKFLYEDFHNKPKGYGHDFRDDSKKYGKLLFAFSGGAQEYVKKLLEDAIGNQDPDKRHFYDELVELALSGFNSIRLYRHFPELIVKLAKRDWITSGNKKKKTYHSREIDDEYGLNTEIRRDFFPASGLRTPTYWLLKYHPEIGLGFVTYLLNYSTNEYARSNYTQAEPIPEFSMLLSDGSTIVQKGDLALWCMYRGIGVSTPYVLQSVLMGLEKFLLELGEEGSNKQAELQKYIKYLYSHSTSVATTAVISSVAQAYPIQVGSQILPLFAVLEFFDWDGSRFMHEASALAPYLPDVPNLQVEQHKSNQLPHRKKYRFGLRGFIVDYCFVIREFNTEIFEIINKHRAFAKNEFTVQKLLDEIDVRMWMADGSVIMHEGKPGMIIKPTYSEGIKEEIEKNAEFFSEYQNNTSVKVWLLRAKKGEERPDLIKWQDAFKLYKNAEFQMHEHVPGVLAYLGVRDYWAELSSEERDFCYKIITEFVLKLLERSYKPFELVHSGISPFDDDAVFAALPMLLGTEYLTTNGKDLESLLLHLLISPLQSNDPKLQVFMESYQDNLWKTIPSIANKYWIAIIKYAKFFKDFPKPHEGATTEAIEDYNQKIQEFIVAVIEDNRPSFDPNISFESHSRWFLKRAVCILPNVGLHMEGFLYLIAIADLYFIEDVKDKRYKDYDDQLFEIRHKTADKISNIIFWDAPKKGCNLLKYFVERFHVKDIFDAISKPGNEIYDFFRRIFKNLIYITDKNMPDSDPEKTKQTIDNFWMVWKCFSTSIEERKGIFFADILLLDIPWNDNATHWKPLDGKQEFFKEAIEKYGLNHISSMVNLLSHIGTESLLPDGFRWFMKVYKDNYSITNPPFANLVKLAARMYDNYSMEIKSDKALLSEYLWLLDLLIDWGSSEAYWVREYLVAYK